MSSIYDKEFNILNVELDNNVSHSNYRDFVLHLINYFCKTSSKDRKTTTYIGIGSAFTDINYLSDQNDQIIPKFIDDIIDSMYENESVRIINFDPMFKIYADSIYQYHMNNRHGYIFDLKHISQNVQIWRSVDNIIESIVINQEFNFETDLWFIESFVKDTIENMNKLIIQSYTGCSLYRLRNMIYNNLSLDIQKEIFKKKVLIDIAVDDDYNSLSGCFFDYSVWKPLYRDETMVDFYDTMTKRSDPKV